MKIHCADTVFVKMQDSLSDFKLGSLMDGEYLNMYNELSNLITDDHTPKGSDVLDILKKTSSSISVFDMMEFTSQVIKENQYVQESYRKDSQKSYIESFLFRVKDILNDNRDYDDTIDRKSFSDAVEILKKHYELGTKDTKSKSPLIFEIASIYATFILKKPIHPVGTFFP